MDGQPDVKVPKPVNRVWTIRMSNKAQITVPVKLRRRFGLTPGVQVDILPRLDGTFVATVRQKSRILDFAGDLADVKQQNQD